MAIDTGRVWPRISRALRGAIICLSLAVVIVAASLGWRSRDFRDSIQWETFREHHGSEPYILNTRWGLASTQGTLVIGWTETPVAWDQRNSVSPEPPRYQLGRRVRASSQYTGTFGFIYQSIDRRSPSNPNGLNLVNVGVPYWFLLVLGCLPGLLLLALRLLRLRHRTPGDLCPSCGYDLRATPTQCPECGHRPPSPAPNATDPAP